MMFAISAVTELRVLVVVVVVAAVIIVVVTGCISFTLMVMQVRNVKHT